MIDTTSCIYIGLELHFSGPWTDFTSQPIAKAVTDVDNTESGTSTAMSTLELFGSSDWLKQWLACGKSCYFIR